MLNKQTEYFYGFASSHETCSFQNEVPRSLWGAYQMSKAGTNSPMSRFEYQNIGSQCSYYIVFTLLTGRLLYSQTPRLLGIF